MADHDKDSTSAPPAGGSQARRARATIRDVARAAGVSIGTVSKVLNGNGSIGAETRQRVVETARTLQFRPNSLAQSLHTGLSRTVGLISNDSFGRFTMPILEGLEECLHDQGMGIFMCNATDDPARERRHVEQLLGKQVDGLIVTARRSDYRPSVDLHQLNVPVIYVFARSEDEAALNLLPDDEGGARLATAHLAALGRRRIAHITGPEHFEAVRLRRAGYLTALDEAGLPADARHCLHGDWSEEWGREAVATLWSGDKPPDGLFCGNDQIARGAIEALRERGLLVPEDAAVVGFDNWSVMTDACRPPLTSVDMNLCELGRDAGRRMTALIEGRPERGVRRLPCTLVVRQSCGGAAPADGKSMNQGELS